MADAQSTSQQRPAIRQLFLTAVFTIFLALVVFAVGTSAFIAPLLAAHELRLQMLEQEVAELRAELDDALAEAPNDEAEEAPADTVVEEATLTP